MDNNEQGGAVGKLTDATIRNVVSNVQGRSNKPATWQEKSGFLGSAVVEPKYGLNWNLHNLLHGRKRVDF